MDWAFTLADFQSVTIGGPAGGGGAGGGGGGLSGDALLKLASLGAMVLLLIGALVFWVWGLFLVDLKKKKDSRRCPKCWYDMSATEGMRCPECGREQAKEKRFRKRRWSRRLAGVSVLLMVLAYASYVTPGVKRWGWMGAVPRSVLVLITPLVETPSEGMIMDRLLRRNTQAQRQQVLTQLGMQASEEPSVPQQLWLHLHCDWRLLPDALRWQQIRVLKDLIGRREPNRRRLDDLIMMHSMSPDGMSLLEDEEILRLAIESSLCEPRYSEDGELVVGFENGISPVIFPLDISINGRVVRRVKFFSSGGARAFPTSAWFGADRFHFRVPETREVFVVCTRPDDVPANYEYTFPNRIEFKFTLDESYFDAARARMNAHEKTLP